MCMFYVFLYFGGLLFNSTNGCELALNALYGLAGDNVDFSFNYSSRSEFVVVNVQFPSGASVLTVIYNNDVVLLTPDTSPRISFIGAFDTGDLSFTLNSLISSDKGTFKLTTTFGDVKKCLTLYSVVPVTTVEITDVNGNGIEHQPINVNEASQGFTMLCTTAPGGSQPEANITWWMTLNNGRYQQITKNITSLSSIPLGDGRVVSRSRVTVADRIYNGAYVFCTANLHGDISSNQVEFDIQYGPGESVNVGNNNYIVTEGANVGPVTCTADCNPPCSFNWMQDNVLISTGPVLELRTVSKTDAGEYICEASTLVIGEPNSARVSLRVEVYSIDKSADGDSGNSVGLSVGLAFAGLVTGSILFSIICLYRKQLQKSQCCRGRLYAKPRRQTNEHTYSEVTHPQSMELADSRDVHPATMTHSAVQIEQAYVNTRID